LPSFEAAFSQSETYNFPGLQAVRLRATISKALKIGVRDWRLPTLTRTTVLNEGFNLGNTWASRYVRVGKDPAPSATPGAIHRGVGYASMAEENSVCWKHEGIVGELHGGQCLWVQHQRERFAPITWGRGDTGGGGGRGRPSP